MTKLEKVFFKLAIIIPSIMVSVHLLLSIIYSYLNIDGIIPYGYLSVIALTLIIDIPISIVTVSVIHFIKETILYKQTKAFSRAYLYIIISTVASILTIICYLSLQIFIEAIINDLFFLSMICFLLVTTVFLIMYTIFKKRTNR